MSSHSIQYNGRSYLLPFAPTFPTLQESQFYMQEVNKRATFADGSVHFPRFFGIAAWSHELTFEVEEIPSSPFSSDEPEAEKVTSTPPPAPEYIVLANLAPRNYAIPLVRTVNFKLQLAQKTKDGFKLFLEINGERLRGALPLMELDWDECSLYLSYALRHGKIYFNTWWKKLTFQPCLAISQIELDLH